MEQSIHTITVTKTEKNTESEENQTPQIHCKRFVKPVTISSLVKSSKKVNLLKSIKIMKNNEKHDFNTHLNLITQKIAKRKKQGVTSAVVINLSESKLKQTEMLIKELGKPKLKKKLYGRRDGSIEGHRDIDKIVNSLKSINGFMNFCRYNKIDNDKTLMQMAGCLKLAHYEKGENIFEVGDDPDYFYGIISGSVSIRDKKTLVIPVESKEETEPRWKLNITSNISKEKDENHIEYITKEVEEIKVILTDGACFGEKALIQDSKRSNSVYAEESTYLFYLTKKHFNQIFKTTMVYHHHELKKFILSHFVGEHYDSAVLEKFYTDLLTKFYSASDVIYEKDTKADRIYLVINGDFALFTNNDKNLSSRILTCTRGDLIGLETLDNVYSTNMKFKHEYKCVAQGNTCALVSASIDQIKKYHKVLEYLGVLKEKKEKITNYFRDFKILGTKMKEKILIQDEKEILNEIILKSSKGKRAASNNLKHFNIIHKEKFALTKYKSAKTLKMERKYKDKLLNPLKNKLFFTSLENSNKKTEYKMINTVNNTEIKEASLKKPSPKKVIIKEQNKLFINLQENLITSNDTIIKSVTAKLKDKFKYIKENHNNNIITNKKLIFEKQTIKPINKYTITLSINELGLSKSKESINLSSMQNTKRHSISTYPISQFILPNGIKSVSNSTLSTENNLNTLCGTCPKDVNLNMGKINKPSQHRNHVSKYIDKCLELGSVLIASDKNYPLTSRNDKERAYNSGKFHMPFISNLK